MVSYYRQKLDEFLATQPAEVRGTFDGIIQEGIEGKRNYFSQHMQPLVDGLPDSTFWKHQQEAITNTAKHIAGEGNTPTAITIIPAGGGKTEIFQAITNALGQDVKLASDAVARVTPRTIILEPTNQLVEQTYDRYKGNAEKGIKPLYPNMMIGKTGDGKESVQPLTIMTYDLFMDWLKDGKITSQDVDYLFLDEAHRGLSDARQEEFTKLIGKMGIFAYTATPAFDAKKNVYELFGKENEVINVPIRELVKDRILPPQTNIMLEIDIDGELPESPEARRKLFVDAATEATWKMYKEYSDPQTGVKFAGKQFLAYTRDTGHARQLRTHFHDEIAKSMEADPAFLGDKTYQHYAEAVSYHDSDKLQRSAITRFGNGKTLGLANAQLLREGANFPDVKLIFGHPTGSVVKELQTHGRANRIIPDMPVDDPNQRAYLVDVFFRVNGQVIGDRVFYHQLVDAADIGQLVKVRFETKGTAAHVPVDPALLAEDIMGQETEGAPGIHHTREESSVHLVPGDLSISSNYHDIVRIDNEFSGRKYPDVSLCPGMLTFSGMKAKASVPLNDASDIYDALKAKWLAAAPVFDETEKCYRSTNGTSTISADVAGRNYNIPVDKCGMFLSGGNSAFFIDESQYTQFRKAPAKEQGMLIAEDMAASTTLSEMRMSALYKKLKMAWDEAQPIYDEDKKHYVATVPGKDPISVEYEGTKYEIPVSECGVYRSRAHYPFCVSASQKAAFGTDPYLLSAPGVPSGMRSYAAMQGGMEHVPAVYKKLEEAWRQAQPVYDKAASCYKTEQPGKDPLKVEVDGRMYEIPISACGIFKRDPSTAFYVHESQEPKFSAPRVVPGMKIYAQMCGLAYLHQTKMRPIYDDFERSWHEAKPIYDEEKKAYVPTVPGKQDAVAIIHGREEHIPISQCGMFRGEGSNKTSFYIHESQCKKLQRAPDPPSGMLLANQARPILKKSPETVYEIYKLLEKAWEDAQPKIVYDESNHGKYVASEAGKDPLVVSVGAKEFTIPFDQCGVYRALKNCPFYVHESQLPVLKEIGDAIQQPKKSADDDPPDSQGGGLAKPAPRSIKPDAAHIRQRQGRSITPKE